MKPITPPLQKSSQGSEVKNLHYILFFLAQKINNPLVNNLFDEAGFRSLHGRDIEVGVIDTPTASTGESLRQEKM
ncbi:MAG: hypothetical protein ABI691_16515 [Ginsengibacter sp.]